MRRACLAAVGALLLPLLARAEPPVIPKGTLTLEELMHHMATTTGVRAAFHETKELALLEAPLESDGELYFVPPDRMARITTRPGASTLVIDGARMSFRDETGATDVDLSASRVARTVVENFVVLFNGDLPGLRERYHVDYSADGARWRMRLVPKAAPLSQFIAEVSLRGDGPALEEMVIVEREGDRTVTRFHDMETGVRFGADELARLFPQGASPTKP